MPPHLDVHLVVDNSSTDKTPAIQRWLVRHPRFTLHFTPTYSSWLNLVERWFAELTTKSIKRGSHRSVRDLVASIRTWIANWNDDPKPFVWHKTADEILENLAAYCQRINDSGRWPNQGTFLNCECALVPSGAVVRLVSVLFSRDSILE